MLKLSWLVAILKFWTWRTSRLPTAAAPLRSARAFVSKRGGGGGSSLCARAMAAHAVSAPPRRLAQISADVGHGSATDQEEAGPSSGRTALHPRQHRAHHTLKVDHHALAHTHHGLLSTDEGDLSPWGCVRKRSTPASARASVRNPLVRARARWRRHRNAERGGSDVYATRVVLTSTQSTRKKRRGRTSQRRRAAAGVVRPRGRLQIPCHHRQTRAHCIRPTPLVQCYPLFVWSSRA